VDPDSWVLVQLGLVTFVAATLQGAAGFGFGLLALPAFMVILDSTDAVPLVIILSLVLSAGLAAKIRHEVHRPLLERFLGGTVLGLPLGLFAFQRAGGDQLMVVVSGVVLAFVAFLVFQGKVRAPATSDPSFRGWTAGCVGAMGGAMTMALGMPGPPIVLYLTRLGVRKDTLRATTLAFSAVSYSASLILQSAVVGVGREVWGSAAILVPVALGGGWIGNQLSCYVSEAVFRRATLVLITLTGVAALAAALR
jgi:uncharacterized membrane protein YfcA